MVTSSPRTDRARFPVGVSSEYFKRKIDPRYFFYEERFNRLPGAQGDYTLTTATSLIPLNKDITVADTNAATTDVAFLEGGGATLTTAGADEDECVIRANTTAGQSALLGMNWDTANEPYMHALVVMPATITLGCWFFGFLEGTVLGTATSLLKFTTPTDQFAFMYSPVGGGALASTTNWQTNTSRAGTDTSTDTGVTVAASTLYRLETFLDQDRIPQFYVNGTQVSTGDNTALESVSDIEFYLGVMEEGTNAARSVSIRNFAVSQLYG